VPDDIRGASAKMSFIAAQRERLVVLMSALDREASQIQTQQTEEEEAGDDRGGSLGDGFDGASGAAPLSKSRSEADFEKLEAESGEEEEDAGALRRRTPGLGGQAAGWVSWAWAGGGKATVAGGDGDGGGEGKSTGIEK